MIYYVPSLIIAGFLIFFRCLYLDWRDGWNTDTFRAHCPMCGAQQEWFSGSAPGSPWPWPGVLHSAPPCAKFIELDPADFLKSIRVALIGELH